MDNAALSKAIRERAQRLANCDQAPLSMGELYDDAELLICLARIIEGRDVSRAFGSPGDWGYNTPIGRALAAAPVPTEQAVKR